ncbi:MAG: hypothetical protein U0Y68_08520 [Blastocatellia bacterium]
MAEQAKRSHVAHYCKGLSQRLLAPRFVAVAVGQEVVREFPYGAVRLTGGRLKQQFDQLHAHYLSLSNDRLLKVFRQRAGLPAPGAEMGGWYDAKGFVPG